MSSCCGCSCDMLDHQADSGDDKEQIQEWSGVPGTVTADIASEEPNAQVCFMLVHAVDVA